MLEPLKGFFRGSRGGTGGAESPFALQWRQDAPASAAAVRRSRSLSSRPSRGLEEFFTQIRDTSGLTILDLGGATQKNVSFITDLGHRLYSEDFLRILNEAFGADDTVDQIQPGADRVLPEADAGLSRRALRRRAGLGCAGVPESGAVERGGGAPAPHRAAEGLHAGVLPLRRQAWRRCPPTRSASTS